MKHHIAMIMIRTALCFAAIQIFSVPAIAGEDGPDIEGIDVEAGETEIELEARFLDTDEGTGLEFQLQGEHALSDAWSVGAELELEREAGESLEADTALARLKWRAPVSQSGFALAVQLGGGYDFGAQRPLAEAAVFAGWANDKWSLATRFDVEAVLGRNAEPEFGYRGRLLRLLSDDFAVGLEAAGDIDAEDPAEHRFGPLLQFPLGGDEAPVLELGAFAGLNRATPDMFYRVEVEFEF